MKLFRKIPTIKRCSKTERAQLAPNTVDENTPAPLSITVNFQNTRKILQTFTENIREGQEEAVTEEIKRTGSRTAFSLVQFTQLCPTLCDPMNHSTPDLPVLH